MKSIKQRLIVIIMIFTLFICVTLGAISLVFSQNAVVNEVMTAIEHSAQEGAKLVRSQLDIQLTYLQTVSDQPVFYGDVTEETIMSFLSNEASRMGYQVLGISSLEGDALRSDGTVVNIADRDFFILAKQGQANVSDVLIDKTNGEPIVIYAVPVVRNNVVTAVIYGVRNGNELSALVGNIDFGDNGYAYMINNQGVTIAHPDMNLVINFDNTMEDAKKDTSLKELADVERKMTAGEFGAQAYNYNGIRKLMGYAPVSGSNWSLAITIGDDEAMEGVNHMRNLILGIAVLLIGVGIAAAFFISSSIAKPISSLAGVLERFANYDLSFDENHEAIQYMKRKDEVGVITNSIAKMQGSLTNLIKQAISSSELVGASSEQLSASIQEISSNAQNQASTTQEISSSMEEISANISMVSDNMISASKDVNAIDQSMSEVETIIGDNNRNLETINDSIRNILSAIDGTRSSINTISEKSKLASKEADDTEAMASDGRKNLEKTVNQMESIQSTITNLSQVIDGLGEAAGQIGDITDMIKDVAEQTNLLALNASIEAARAGEHGKGFAVVAQAIGNLAEESSSATTEITKVIKNIQAEIAKAIHNSEEGTKVVKNGTYLVKETSTSLEKIFEAIHITSDIIHDITKHMEVQAKDTENVYHSANDINDRVNNLMSSMEEETAIAIEFKNKCESLNQLIGDISQSMEQQSSATDQVSCAINDNAAGIEEISSSSEEIAKNSEELALSAQELIKQVQKFKL